MMDALAQPRPAFATTSTAGLRSFTVTNGDHMIPDGESGFAIEPIDEFAEHGNEQAENGSQKHSP